MHNGYASIGVQTIASALPLGTAGLQLTTGYIIVLALLTYVAGPPTSRSGAGTRTIGN